MEKRAGRAFVSNLTSHISTSTDRPHSVKASSPKAEGVSVVEEGGEPDGFWAALGGIATYPTTKAGEAPPREPRLFQVRLCSWVLV